MARRRKTKLPPPSIRALSREKYDALPGINWSTLKWLQKSPAEYDWRIKYGKEETDAILRGRLVHTAILEPDRVPLDYAIWPGGRRAGAEWEAFQAANGGRTLVRIEDYQDSLRFRDAVLAHKHASRILSGGTAERTLTWVETIDGIQLGAKGRLDYLRAPEWVDLKTTSDLDLRRFGAQAFRLGYHGQAAWYRRGLRANGIAEPKCWIIAVESSDPHDVAVFEPDPSWLATGDELVDRLLRTLLECRKTKRWPGRYPEITPLEIPAWAYEAPDEADPLSGLVIGGAA
jgi:hypothetical protein